MQNRADVVLRLRQGGEGGRQGGLDGAVNVIIKACSGKRWLYFAQGRHQKIKKLLRMCNTCQSCRLKRPDKYFQWC